MLALLSADEYLSETQVKNTLYFCLCANALFSTRVVYVLFVYEGKLTACREVFGETLNESRDADIGDIESRYSSRLYLKHTSLEQAFDMLYDAGFRLSKLILLVSDSYQLLLKYIITFL